MRLEGGLPPAPQGGGLRPLVLCADDFAMSRAVSEGIADLLAMRRLSATSAMVLSPRWAEDAALLRPLRGQVDVGLHLDWTSAFAIEAGHGLPLGRAMLHAALGRFRPEAVRPVIERQLDAFEAQWQAPPDHIDGHQHVQQFHGIREVLLESLLRRYPAQRPWLRISQAPAALRDAKARVIAAWGATPLVRAATAAGIPCARWLAGIYDFSGGMAGYARHMAHWLALAPAGTVLMCHPARQAPTAEPDDGIAAARAWEQAYLASPAFAMALQTAGVRLARGGAHPQEISEA